VILLPLRVLRGVAILVPLLASIGAAAVAPERVGCAAGVPFCAWWQLVLLLAIVLVGVAGTLGPLTVSVVDRRAGQ
jgi:CDP-diglyceride synthetase